MKLQGRGGRELRDAQDLESHVKIAGANCVEGGWGGGGGGEIHTWPQVVKKPKSFLLYYPPARRRGSMKNGSTGHGGMMLRKDWSGRGREARCERRRSDVVLTGRVMKEGDAKDDGRRSLVLEALAKTYGR